MRILIASDIHGSVAGAARFRDKVKEMKPDMVLLLGDILYHGPRNPLPEEHDPPAVVAILSDLGVSVAAVRGNCDAEVDQLVLPFHLAENAWIIDDGRRLLAMHGHQLPDDESEIKVEPGTAILSGHIHIPVAEKRGPVHRWNPGSTSLPKENYPASFGLYENGRFTVMSFAGEILKSDALCA